VVDGEEGESRLGGSEFGFWEAAQSRRLLLMGWEKGRRGGKEGG